MASTYMPLCSIVQLHGKCYSKKIILVFWDKFVLSAYTISGTFFNDNGGIYLQHGQCLVF